MNKNRLIPLIAVVALVATWAGIEASRHAKRTAEFNPPSQSSAEAVAKILTSPLKTTAGDPKTLATWEGKIVVVNFWATWCPPCRKEMPEFSRVHNQLSGKGVQFVGIAIDSAENVVEFSKTLKVDYPLLVGSTEILGLTAYLGNVQQGLPFTLILGRDGKLVASYLGELSESDLTLKLTPLL